MMKKFVKFIVSAITVMGIGALAYAQVPEKVEINFAVGDETLLINGDAVTVQKPYVVGDGVTLVPLRVITEAFGAEVEWIGETQQIKLTYPDVNINLQIGNKIAEVNGVAETLLSAPELKNDTTMVPLRFISETFGADVSYDYETMGIKVIKETADTSGTIIDEVITQPKIGDSYYGWSMENPAEFDMTYRSFDGSSVIFEADENNFITIDIYDKDENYNFERDFINTKNSLSGYTLIKADKNTDMLIKSMNFQAKDTVDFFNMWIFETDKYIVEIGGFFEVDKTDIKNEGVRLMETFSCSFTKDDTYDFSDVKEGMREFKSDKLKLSFSVPQDYYMVSSETAENSFMFKSSDAEDTVSTVVAEVYSKSDVVSAEALANKDHDGNKKYINPELVTFTDVKPAEYTNFKGFEYTYKISGSTKNDAYSKDVFFELGEYVYNIHVTRKNTTDADKNANKVLNSVKAQTLDFEEIGILMRNDSDYEGDYTVKTDKWSLSLPNSYSEISEGQYYCLQNGASVSVSVEDASGTNMSDIKKEMEETIKEVQKEIDIKVKAAPGQKKLAGNQMYMGYTVVFEENGSYYREISIIIANKKVTFSMLIPEVFYSDRTVMEIDGIIASYKNEY